MKTEIKDQMTATAASDNQPDVMRLSLRVKTKLKTGAFAVAPCPTHACHC